MRDTEHFKIALHQTVLAWCTMLHDISEIELHLLTIYHNREICLVHLWTSLLREYKSHGIALSVCCNTPFSFAGEDFIYIVQKSVDAGCCELSTAN